MALKYLNTAIAAGREFPRLSLEEIAYFAVEEVAIVKYLLTIIYNELYAAKIQVFLAQDDLEAAYETARLAELDGVKNLAVRLHYQNLQGIY